MQTELFQTLKRKALDLLKLFGGIAVLALLVLAAILYFRPEYESLSSIRFSRVLAAAVHSGNATVHLRDIPSSSWQRVYIFGPYTYPEQISKTLGFPWNGSALEDIESSDGKNLLLFVRNKRVVMSVLHPRSDGDFVPGPDSVGRGFAKDDAQFAIVRRAEDNGLVLTPLSNSR